MKPSTAATIVTIVSLTALLLSTKASASTLDELKSNYVGAAEQALESSAYNSAAFYIECTPSKSGDTAVCNALTSSPAGRKSISMSCTLELLADRYSLNTATFSCKIRRDASADRYAPVN